MDASSAEILSSRSESVWSIPTSDASSVEARLRMSLGTRAKSVVTGYGRFLFGVVLPTRTPYCVPIITDPIRACDSTYTMSLTAGVTCRI